MYVISSVCEESLLLSSDEISVLLHLRMTRLFRNRWGEKKENEVNLDLSTECEESYRLVGDSSRRSHSA